MSLERLSLSLSVRPRCEMRPLSVGALRTPFIQRYVTMPQFQSFVKDFQNLVAAIWAIRIGGSPVPDAASSPGRHETGNRLRKSSIPAYWPASGKYPLSAGAGEAIESSHETWGASLLLRPKNALSP